MPFLFIWQFIFSGPLEISSGYIGFAQYLSYFRRGMGVWEMRAASVVVGVLVVVLLYRGIQAIGRLTVVLWIGPEAPELATSSDELRERGTADPVAERADAALVRGLALTDAELRFVPGDEPPPKDGIAALLR